ncbi:TetR family transcriptional regulator [Mycobacterium sp. GA-1841]|uniref:TetR/AcrR family transcriptional regulator n=1 Tax=Mycobacterium sp. GA-1841 TaxID=1834154 RepID=UPI00096CA636|nr:TetR/AcrR family transcriptional regulator [Mycobacterium sp. GA-1841]OMC38272.1 TetR family transcriptional regulator [Mycobacterium sp. GA-1841]
MRADAARNRARVLEVAYETFAADGLSVPIDEIARRAGVGAGTVYRHFPSKEDLFRAVIAERIRSVVDEGRAMLADEPPADALFTFLRSMVLQWGAADRGLVDALAGLGIDVKTVVPEAEDEYLSVLGDLLAAGQSAGTVRRDVTVADVTALLVGCQAMQSYNDDVADRVTSVVFDGLRVGGRAR